MTVADNLAGVTVEIGFGVNAFGSDYFVLNDPARGELDNTTYLLAPETVFVDITASVAAIAMQRGRERELDEYQTGTATVVFNDNDRTFDPSYSGSPYYGQITPMRRIQIRWGDTPLFTGWVDDWAVTYEPGDRLSRVTADCVDALGILANQELNEIGAAHAGDTSGARVSRVLDRAEIHFPWNRDIDVGSSTLGSTTLGGNALAYLQACARAEAGYLFVTADGVLTFLGRGATLNAMTDVVLSDDRDAGIQYRQITQRSTSDLLYTRVTGQSETTSNPLSADDVAAQDEYFIRTLPLGTLFTADDIQTQSLIDYYLNRFSTPELRFHTATFNVATLDPDDVATIVSFDLTDAVNVERSPLNVGDTITRLSLIDKIDHRISHGSWVAELAFANIDTRSFLILDDAVFGTLSYNRLAF